MHRCTVTGPRFDQVPVLKQPVTNPNHHQLPFYIRRVYMFISTHTGAASRYSRVAWRWVQAAVFCCDEIWRDETLRFVASRVSPMSCTFSMSCHVAKNSPCLLLGTLLAAAVRGHNHYLIWFDFMIIICTRCHLPLVGLLCHFLMLFCLYANLIIGTSPPIGC